MPVAAAPAGRAPTMTALVCQQVRPCRPFCAASRQPNAVPAARISTVRLGGARQLLAHRARQPRQRPVHLSAVADATATFTVPAQPLAFGEHLRLVGSAEQMGGWDPAAGLALEWAEGDNWSAEAALPEGSIEFKVVVAKGDGSFYWEELADNANRTVDVAGDALSVTCHMGGDTEVSSGSGSAPASAEQPASQGAERPSAIDMSVDMDAAKELNPSFSVQASYDGAEGMEPGAAEASDDSAVEDETAELIEEKIGGQEQVGGTYKAAGPPGEDAMPEANEAAAGEGAPADEEESAQDTAGASSGAVAADAVQGPELSGGDGGGGADSHEAGVAKAIAQGDGRFMGRHDVEVKDDGSITFSLDPTDQGVQQLVADILGRLQQ